MTLHSIVIQKLLSTNAHLGRRVATHHFKLFTYGNRNGMNIIDSDKTLICLRNACDFIASLVRQNGRFMFINTNPLFDEIFEQMTKKIGCYSSNINALWRTGGFLTNSCSPKKFRSRNKKLCFGPTQPPDCLVIMDTERKSSVILEAAKLQIPVVALVDSSMPWDCYKRITYPIPANDSVQFVYLLCNMITKTILLEQKKLAAAKAQLAIAKTETRDELRRIKDSTSKSDGGAEYAKIEVPVIPYEQLASLPEDVAEIKKLLDKLVVLKLNGTLGTSMGFDGPKSMIEIGNGMMVLDLVANRIKCLNSKYGCNVPLLLMNSSRTHDFTPEVLEKYQKPTINIHAFELNTHWRLSGEHINEDELVYAEQSALILSLMKAGTLDVLISQGKEYILVVSADNVGTIIDPKILNHLIQNNVECGMEVRPAASTAVNGSIQNFQGRTFQLGEIAQRPSEDLSQKFKLIDTKNLWVNLHAIKRVVDANATITGEDVSSSLLRETATGSAIRLFKHAIGINVPSSHFFPLNATSDLLLLQSDLYALSEGVLTRNPTRANPEDPSIHLGPEFETLSNFRSRFQSIPSVVELDRLKVIGDVWFGKGIKLKGNVSIVASPGTRIQIPDGVVLENKLINNPEDI